MEITFKHEHHEDILLIIPIVDGKEFTGITAQIEMNMVDSLKESKGVDIIAETEAAMKLDIETNLGG